MHLLLVDTIGPISQDDAPVLVQSHIDVFIFDRLDDVCRKDKVLSAVRYAKIKAYLLLTPHCTYNPKVEQDRNT